MPDQPEAPATPWPDWLADLTPEDRVREIVSLHAHWCHGADGRCSGSEAVDLLMRLLDEARQQAPVRPESLAADRLTAAEAPREPQRGNPAAEVPSEPVLDAVTRIREWAAAEPSGLMLRRDVVGTLDRVLAMSPERAAELADYRGRIANAVALLHQSSEYAISDALAGHLTRILSDPLRTGSGPSGPT